MLNHLAEQQSARRALEARLQTNTHWKEMNDAQQAQARLRDRLATADLRLSALLAPEPLPPRVVTVGCEKPPVSEVWSMAQYAPNLTERMLNELSPSPMKATCD
ncbi:hypothetical protein [Pseudomonas sp. LM20]|uniref:hypothetical protein n=1 Tax=Pseudomonas sp. LM20 TaxID=2899116 RepID=UPI003FA34722